MAILFIGGECRQQHHAARIFLIHLVDDAVLGVDQGRQFGQQHCPTVPRSRWPCNMPVKRARLVLSQSCSVLRSVVRRRLLIMVLILSFSSATSPLAST